MFYFFEPEKILLFNMGFIILYSFKEYACSWSTDLILKFNKDRISDSMETCCHVTSFESNFTIQLILLVKITQ